MIDANYPTPRAVTAANSNARVIAADISEMVRRLVLMRELRMAGAWWDADYGDQRDVDALKRQVFAALNDQRVIAPAGVVV